MKTINAASIGHCQMHGEPYDISARVVVHIILPSGKKKSSEYRIGTTDQEIIADQEGHPRNLKGYTWKWVEWIPNVKSAKVIRRYDKDNTRVN